MSIYKAVNFEFDEGFVFEAENDEIALNLYERLLEDQGWSKNDCYLQNMEE